MTPSEYVGKAITESLNGRGYNVLQEAGFTFEDFVAKYAEQLPVAYVSYAGFNPTEARENDIDVAESFTVYLRADGYDELYGDVKRIRKYVKKNDTFFDEEYDEEKNTNEKIQWFAIVAAGTPTLFTKGFDSFELTFSFTN